MTASRLQRVISRLWNVVEGSIKTQIESLDSFNLFEILHALLFGVHLLR